MDDDPDLEALIRRIVREELGVTAWMTADEAAAYLRIAPKTLANWRALEKGPAWVKRGRLVRYRRDSIERFAESGQRERPALADWNSE